MDAGHGPGSTVVVTDSGKRVYLPFQADCVLRVEGGAVTDARIYRNYHWQPTSAADFKLESRDAEFVVSFRASTLFDCVRAVQWFRQQKDGLIILDRGGIRSSNNGDVYFSRYYTVEADGQWVECGRYGALGNRPRIYQMLPRLFGNENETRKVNGTLAENGVGKFSDLSLPVLQQLKADGLTHIWLTGVLQQATSTDYSKIGQAPDDPDLLKGIAGSPYAVRDYFDISPDYADNPAQRLDEFKALAERMHTAGLKLLIDFIPNHVARSYASDIHPELDFGVNDRKNVYFDSDNNFYYLTSKVAKGNAPLRLPTVDHKTGRILNETARLVGHADGYFMPERVHGRVTGNNQATWRPTDGDWYETVKLNYGFDFIHRDRPPEYPTAVSPRKPTPDTWKKMDAILAYWQSMGVDGFRVDMAHMVPPEFWKWSIHRAKERDAEVFFCAEAYNDDPAKVPSHDPALEADTNVMVALLDAGFQAVYDDPGYDTLEKIYHGSAWANDLQTVEDEFGPYFFECALRYAENHDEVRLANSNSWGGLGMEVGRPVAGTLFGLSQGPVMIYHGQEVGELGEGREGFGGDDQRSTIFDYWSLPELNKWWNGGAADGGHLSPAQVDLRAWYVRLLKLQVEPAFTQGTTIMLNHANVDNPAYGRVERTSASGHWIFSYLRSDMGSGSHYLVTANFNPQSGMSKVRIHLPEVAAEALALNRSSNSWLVLRDRLSTSNQLYTMKVSDVLEHGIYVEQINSLDVNYWEIRIEREKPGNSIMAPTMGRMSSTRNRAK
ncbi:hypothetical protein GCM10007047_15250 [Cerasicoccus arenae]|uniref:Glycosyl hydrolase family 13 catalytic domain-containing protein n=2 Tax=Cerasicoccus arenae TaxID=424488 RepID=A0A8J3DH91_9BACT|nr:hypothetical protein GCM10007047_15250 [Cerasicoccus arenae]